MKTSFLRDWAVAAALAALGLPARAGADDASLFRDRVAPVLRQRCVTCHNGRKTRGGIDLTSRQALLQGGTHGAVVVPGNAAGSKLVGMISGPEPRMPKQGARLTPEE